MSAKKTPSAKISDSRLIVALGALYALLQVTTFLKIYVEQLQAEEAIDIPMMIRDRAVAFSVAIVFIILIVKTTRRYLLKNRSWRKIIAIHLFFAILISLLWYTTFIFAASLFCHGENCKGGDMEFIFWYLYNFDKLFLLYLITVSVTYTYYYVQRDSIHQIQRSQIENQLLQTRMMMLKSQLHPHFLFNTLNSIACLIDIDVQKAKNMIADLGDLLRHVLDHKDTQIVSVEEEIVLLNKYIDIEKIRFSEDLEINLRISPEIGKAEIPSMLLQPIVENSIRHGFSRQHPNLKINIDIFPEEEHLIVSVEDNGQGFSPDEESGIFEKGTGLKNTFERLKSIYSDQFRFFVENLHPGVRNRIEIPLNLNLVSN